MIIGNPVQQATSTVKWVIAGIILAVIAATGLYIYKLTSDIEKLTEEKETLSVQLKVSQDQVIQLSDELDRTQRLADLNKSLHETATNIIAEQKKQLAVWEVKYNDITSRMPTKLPDSKVCKETVDEQVNSSLRIQLIWELYCTHGEASECQPVEKKE